MMHGYEKSDSVIVAAKPANKAEQPVAERSAGEPTAAESAEPRTGTKGNASQQSTYRAQNRESVTQALERIRKVAKERKKERFTALYHHIGIDQGVLRAQRGRRAWCGSSDVEGLRGRPRAQARGPAWSGPTWSVSGTTEPARIHTQAGRSTTPARGRRAGGQNCPTSGGRAAECDLRGRLPRHLVWVPARTRHA
jgi:hypothetical protein